jgi:hypothetical protein
MKPTMIIQTTLAIAATLCICLPAVAQPPPPREGDDRPKNGHVMREERVIMLRGEGDGDLLPDLARQVLRDLPDVRPEEFMEFCRQHFPEAMEQLRRLLNAHRPEVALDQLRRMGREFMELRELQRRDPEQFKLRLEIQHMERASHEMAQRFREATDDKQRAEIGKALEELLGKIFDAKQVMRDKEAAHVEMRLKELRETTAARAKNKSAIIKSRLDELTGKRERFEW